MRILDMFSWLPAHELSLEKIEDIFINYILGNQPDDRYMISHEFPENISEDILQYQKEATEAGKKVVCILKENILVALIGYRE